MLKWLVIGFQNLFPNRTWLDVLINGQFTRDRFDLMLYQILIHCFKAKIEVFSFIVDPLEVRRIVKLTACFCKNWKTREALVVAYATRHVIWNGELRVALILNVLDVEEACVYLGHCNCKQKYANKEGDVASKTRPIVLLVSICNLGHLPKVVPVYSKLLDLVIKAAAHRSNYIL